jgi:hypothetical protein
MLNAAIRDKFSHIQPRAPARNAASCRNMRLQCGTAKVPSPPPMNIGPTDPTAELAEHSHYSWDKRNAQIPLLGGASTP